jgi:hypothetical protein
MGVAVQPTQLSPRAELIRKLTAKTPTTYGGIPVGFYRCDLIPFNFPEHPIALDGEQSEFEEGSSPRAEPADLEAAFVELSFQEGFPTQPNGATFWSRLDFESSPAYIAFQLYLEQAETGPRSLAHIIGHPTIAHAFHDAGGSSSDSTKSAVSLINEWYNIYYWAQRARSHDIYHEAAYKHIRARRALYAENKHFELAEKLIDKAASYIGSKQFMDEMTPKTAIEALKVAAQLQRISTGMPSGAPSESKGEIPVQSNFELTIRQVAQKNEVTTVDEHGDLVTDASLAFNDLLDDPNQAGAMQEIIIRMSQASHSNSNSAQGGVENGGGSRDRNKPLHQRRGFHRPQPIDVTPTSAPAPTSDSED